MVDFDKYMPVENIGPRERRRRLVMGIIMLVISVILLFVMLGLNFNRFWRLVLFIPFVMAALGIFQFREKTCVALAAQGWCNFDDGNVRVEDADRLQKIRGRARKVSFHALLTAVILTVLSMALPA